jgi:hypothetical protein
MQPDATKLRALREEAFELLANLRSKLESLDEGADDTRRLARELREMIEEIRQALED